MKGLFSKMIPLILVAVLVVSVFTVRAYAAECTVLEGNIKITDTKENVSVSNNKVTAKAEAAKKGEETNTITVTNNTDSTAKITFDWSADKSYSLSKISCTVDGTTATSGKFDKNIAAHSSITISLYAKGGSWDGQTASLTLSNFTYLALPDSYPVIINNLGNGNVTLDGTSIESGKAYDVSPDGAELVASSSSGYTFLGWVDTASNALLSASSSYTIMPTADMNIQAVFVNTASDTAWFNVDGNYLTSDLNKASELGTKIVLANNGTLAAGNYTVAAGDTLLIPFDANNTVYTTEPKIDNGTYVTPSAYRTLTMEEGANITVNGTLCLPAKLSTASGCNSAPTGSISMIKMQTGSAITLGNGGQLYAWGFITGSGSITAENGSTVYEAFQITDWRGGPTSLSMKEVFIFSQYYIRNVEVPLTINSGAREYGVLCVTVDIPIVGPTDANVKFPMLGPSGAMFNISEGSVTKRYDGASDRDVYTVDGTMELSGVEVKVADIYPINTAEYVFPIPGHFTLEAINDSKLVQTQDLVLQPGCQVFIGEDATYTQTNTESDLFVLDRDEWIDKGYVGGGRDLGPCVYCPGRPNGDQTKTLTADDLVDTLIQVDGTMNIVGSFFTSAGGANICSTGTGVIKMTNAPAFGTNKQYTSDYVEIPVTACKLKNAGESYTLTEKSADENSVITNTYTYNGTKWICGTHTEVVDEAVAPDCTNTGLTAGSHCSACNKVMAAQEEVAAKGHTPGEAATCETAQTCTVCNAVITPALGHKDEGKDHTCDNGCGVYQGTHADSESDKDHVCDYGCGEVLENCADGDDKDHNCDVCGKENVSEHSWSDATCTAPKTCSVCGATEGEALGHTPDEAVCENVKDATCSKAGSYDNVVYCSVEKCGVELSRQTVTVPATGEHAWNDGVVTQDPTEESKGVKTYTCGTCGETKTEDIPVLEHVHNLTKVDAKDATCVTNGNIEHYKCDCGKLFSDENGEKEITAEDVVISATNEHSYTTEVDGTRVNATCNATGSVTMKCANCEATKEQTLEFNADNHVNIIQVEAKNATCKDTGYAAYEYCTGCAYTTKGEDIPATGEHKYVDGVCDVCGDKEKLVADVEFANSTLDLASEILLRLKYYIPEPVRNDDSVVMRIVKDSGKGNPLVIEYSMADIKAMTPDSKGRYLFIVPLASAELGRDVTIQFIRDGAELLYIKDKNGEVTDTSVHTAVDYARQAFEMGGADSKALMKGVLVYGGYAQQYFDVDTDNPVYNVLLEYGYEVPSLDYITADILGVTQSESGAATGIKYRGDVAGLDSSIYHQVNFDLLDGHNKDEYTYVITKMDSEGNEYTEPVEANKHNGTSDVRCNVKILDIAAAKLDYLYTITVTHKETKETYVVKDSVMNWVKAALEIAPSVKTVNMAKAIFYYNQAANDYFEK